MKTLPEQIAELTEQLNAANATVKQLTASNTQLAAERDTEKAARVQAESNLTAVTAERDAAKAQVTTLTTEKADLMAKVTTLTAEKATVEQRAVDLMAKVGQPAPVNADAKGAGTEAADPKLTGLDLTAAYFRNRNTKN